MTKLSDRICAIEFNYQNLLKSYDMSKNQTLILLDKFHTLEYSVRTLEQNTGQKIQTFKKAVVKRIEKTEEFFETDEQEQMVQGQDLASSLRATPWDNLHRVSTTYPLVSSERPSGTKHPKVAKNMHGNQYV